MTKSASIWQLLGAGLLGYLVGTFPTADVASHRAQARGSRSDVREAGSRNPGALNAAKILGRKWGLIVLACDMAKGALASLLGRALAGPNGTYAAATASVIGHCYPVWSGLRGGKGVATSFGTTFVCFPTYTPLDLAVAAGTFVLSRGDPALTSSPDDQPAGRIGTYAASAVFSAAAIFWWLARRHNWWGPKPTVGLPLYAIISSSVIAYRFLSTPSLALRDATTPGDREHQAEAVAR